ncbi:hypothetical protein AO385_1760 [Moraxella catarrhalis]|uniref:Uncharacterized protein n=1 Tax=Moraxella catarrhalis TaxID=480 RepID=A0A198UE13_MORCA|nr:hypothetical protein AO383_2282 [Moraxella catarrhalis]OAU94656.1 hypothetical protein AO384_2013 [Moraxella catarrhalis]OAU97044.1 hypothetical protein AO385_1760 [Moraxella catarrhalis]
MVIFSQAEVVFLTSAFIEYYLIDKKAHKSKNFLVDGCLVNTFLALMQ